MKLQNIKFKLMFSHWVITNYFERIRIVPTSSHFHDRFLSCGDFWQICFKRSWRCECTAQIPPTFRILLSKSVWGSDCVFNWNFRLKGPVFMFLWGANCNWYDKIFSIPGLFILIFLNTFTVEYLRCFIQYNGDPGLGSLIWSRNAWCRHYPRWKLLEELS